MPAHPLQIALCSAETVHMVHRGFSLACFQQRELDITYNTLLWSFWNIRVTKETCERKKANLGPVFKSRTWLLVSIESIYFMIPMVHCLFLLRPEDSADQASDVWRKNKVIALHHQTSKGMTVIQVDVKKGEDSLMSSSASLQLARRIYSVCAGFDSGLHTRWIC